MMEEIIVICERLSDNPRLKGTTHNCYICNALVSLSPGTEAGLKNANLVAPKFQCRQCTQPSDIESAQLLPESAQEVKKYLQRN